MKNTKTSEGIGSSNRVSPMNSGEVFTRDQINWAFSMEKRSSSHLSSIFEMGYVIPVIGNICIWLILKLEGGYFFSKTLRRTLLRYHGIKIGNYSYGSCLVPGVLPKGTIVGAYCSFADGLKVFRRNHPLDVLSQHPFFYNRLLGLVPADTIDRNEDNPLIIGNDVWIGYGVTILPSCRYIGDGAVVGAGAVVTRNVEEYTVVAGNPASLIKRRFTGDIENLVRETQWWNLSLPELLHADRLLVSKITNEALKEFLIVLNVKNVKNDQIT